MNLPHINQKLRRENKMSKPKTKQELIQAISKVDVLDLVVETIERKQPSSEKRSQETAFAKASQQFVNDQRDVILIALKIR